MWTGPVVITANVDRTDTSWLPRQTTKSFGDVVSKQLQNNHKVVIKLTRFRLTTAESGGRRLNALQSYRMLTETFQSAMVSYVDYVTSASSNR